MSVRINPSILSADFVNFDTEFQSISEADLIHVDVMDGHFVPNMTFGYPMVSRMQQITPRPLDVHLMIENPDYWAPRYAETGAAMVTFHLEAAKNAVATIDGIRQNGAQVGVAIKPKTEVSQVLELVAKVDQILVMTVEPGFGGQALIEETIAKVIRVRELLDLNHLDTWLQVDGGITASNIERVARAGADTFVAGSAVFAAPDRNAEIRALRALAELGVASRG